MHTAPRRLAATALALTALAVSAASMLGDAQPARPLALIAVLWLVLLGWGFRSLLGRHLRFNDRLADAEAQTGIERHARLLAERALADTHSNLCRLIDQQEQVREQERQRIARDIHDDLGQYLLALKMELSMLQAGIDGGAMPPQHALSSLSHKLDLSIGSLRIVINNLRPPALEHGLQAAIATHLTEFSRISGIRHALAAEPDADTAEAPSQYDVLLWRVLQEALANVARHAHASEVTVALTRGTGQVTLQVRDNGIGMAGQSAARGCGLLGIADRVAAAGGKFVIDSAPGAGTRLSLSLPLSQPSSLPLSQPLPQPLGADAPRISSSLAKYQ